jgi:hypothetical protein
MLKEGSLIVYSAKIGSYSGLAKDFKYLMARFVWMYLAFSVASIMFI